MHKSPENTKDFNSLVEVVEILRSPTGCPWDKEQTHQSLAPFAIEESHELAEAIENGNDADICEELGDVLLQVVLNAQIAKERHAFAIENVIQGITEKMVRRHEHVFGDKDLKTPDEVKLNWDRLKNNEKSKNSNPFINIPKALPALQRSQKIGQKTIRFKFDWENVEQVFLKVDEELAELKEAYHSKDISHIEEELGDTLFTIVQLARHLNIDAESSLRKANHKFEKRFTKLCELIVSDKKEISELGISELEAYWLKAKKELN